MLSLRTLMLIGLAPAALAIALAGCQTAGPAAKSGALGMDRTAAPRSSAQRPNPSQRARARKTNVATSSVLMGVGF
jgi:hypothetical protein